MRRNPARPAPEAPHRWFVIVPATIALLAILNLSVPYFTIEPGDPTPVGDLIRISGVPTQPLSGELSLTTVSVRSLEDCGSGVRFCAQFATAVWGWLSGAVDVVPRSAFVGPEETDEDVERRNTEDMRQSQLFAAAAALSYLGYDVKGPEGILVEQVIAGFPAEGQLAPGDVIVAVEGEPVCGVDSLGKVIDERGAGASVQLGVRRDGAETQLSVDVIEHPADGSPVIGVVISFPGDIELPIDVQIDARSRGGQVIGGPSAGLMFALGVVDLIQDADLVAGRHIAGTGTITPRGCVGAVGGLRQKIIGARRAGADMFLVPQDEFDIACRVADGIQVVGIDRLQDAVQSLADPQAAAERSCG